MADITAFQAGNVSDEGKENWRGDQVTAPQGGQSMFQTSSVPLAELGSRKVVGDRVFRYAKASGTLAAGQGAKLSQNAVLNAQVNITAVANPNTGDRVIIITSSTNLAADRFAEGYIFVQSGTAANQGYSYRIKTHASIGSGATGALTLYDVIQKPVISTDSLTLLTNLYQDVTLGDATGAPAGVTPVAVVSSDYFWLQTWGPTPAYCSAVATAGNMLKISTTGQLADAFIGTDAQNKAVVGYAVQPVCTASQLGMVFLTIAP